MRWKASATAAWWWAEDLGTVPDAVRDALQPMNVLSTRLLYFERQDNGRLQPPQAYPENAVAAVTTHDLPTLAGFWQGLDIDLRDRLHLFPDDEVRNEQVVTRSKDRATIGGRKARAAAARQRDAAGGLSREDPG